MRTSALAFAIVLAFPSAQAKDITHDIGNKRPEGIHIVDGSNLGLAADVPYALVSEAYYGGIKAFDLETGELAKQVVPSKAFKERGGTGITYHDGMILAAGGGNLVGTTAGMYVYDAMTGAEIIGCLPDFDSSDMLVNDVVVIDNKAYWTLSFSNKIPVMDLAAITGDMMEEPATAVTRDISLCSKSITYIDLPAEIFTTDGGGMNGIIPYDSGILISHNDNGGVYFVDLDDGNSVSEALVPGSLTAPDGMVADGDTIYASELGANQISLWTASSSTDSASGKKVVTLTNGGTAITSEFFDFPATIDIDNDVIYTVNLRVGLGLLAEGEEDPDTFSESFHIVGVKLDTEDNEEEPAVSKLSAPVPSNEDSGVLPQSTVSFLGSVLFILANLLVVA